MHIDFDYQTRLFAGLYEVELNRHVRRLCPPGTRSFDVGGNVGYDALVLAKLGKSAVISFECEAELLIKLNANRDLNPRLAPHIRTVRAYVGERTDPDADTVALDDVAFSDDAFVPDFVKIDVEGAELSVLRGAERLLASVGPALIVETHEAAIERECIELLSRHGYRMAVVEQRSWLTDHRPLEHNRWLVATKPS
jgi:hypothetical protein